MNFHEFSLNTHQYKPLETYSSCKLSSLHCSDKEDSYWPQSADEDSKANGINSILALSHLFTTFDIRRTFRTALMTLFIFVESLRTPVDVFGKSRSLRWYSCRSFSCVENLAELNGWARGANSPIMRLRFWSKEIRSKRRAPASKSLNPHPACWRSKYKPFELLVEWRGDLSSTFKHGLSRLT